MNKESKTPPVAVGKKSGPPRPGSRSHAFAGPSTLKSANEIREVASKRINFKQHP